MVKDGVEKEKKKRRKSGRKVEEKQVLTAPPHDPAVQPRRRPTIERDRGTLWWIRVKRFLELVRNSLTTQ